MPTETDDENTLARMRPIGLAARDGILGLVPLEIPAQGQPARSPVVTWEERDEWVFLCVKMGLNAGEISRLSLSWPQPITTVQQTYDKIDSLRLSKLYKKNQKKLRPGAHNQNIIFAFSKLTGQAVQEGHEVWDVMRDHCPDGMKFRPDLQLRIDTRLFYVEVQLSKIEGTRWRQKFRNYLRLYLHHKRPFRVLFLVDKRQDISKLRRQAREVQEDRPGLDLFLFMTLEEFRAVGDVIRTPVWMTSKGDKVPLV